MTETKRTQPKKSGDSTKRQKTVVEISFINLSSSSDRQQNGINKDNNKRGQET